MASKFLKCLYRNNSLMVISRSTHGKCDSGGHDNLSVVLHKKNEIKIEKRPIPKVLPYQVLIEIGKVGIGASDIRYIQDPGCLKEPIVLGHEAGGVVVECGKRVKHLKPGDKVAIDPGKGCGKCLLCNSGRSNICKHRRFCGRPPVDGVLCQYYACRAKNCYKLPCNLDCEHGCLLQPFAVVAHACNRIDVIGGDMIFFTGGGVLSLLGVMLAKACGVSRTIVAANEEYYLKIAKTLGATSVVNYCELKSRDVKEVMKKLNGRLPNKIIECSGDEEIIGKSILSTRPAGKVALLRFNKPTMGLPITDCIPKQLDVIGCNRSCSEYSKLIRALDSGLFDAKCLVTHHFKLEEAEKAFELACKKTEPFVKIMIHCKK